MKKLFALMIAVLLVFVGGCGAALEIPQPDVPSSEAPSEQSESKIYSEELLTEISKSIENNCGFPAELVEEESKVSVTVRATSSIQSDFGNIIKDVCEYCEEILTEKNVEVNNLWIGLYQKSGTSISIPYSFYTSNFHSGVLSNNKLDPAQIYTISSWDDLAEHFPALTESLKAKENGVTDEEMELYNSVMDDLYAQPDKEESEIYQEIAPKYGMEPEELEKYIWDIMERIY